MRVLENAIVLIDWIPDNINFAVIGAVILAGAVADEIIRAILTRRSRRATKA